MKLNILSDRKHTEVTAVTTNRNVPLKVVIIVVLCYAGFVVRANSTRVDEERNADELSVEPLPSRSVANITGHRTAAPTEKFGTKVSPRKRENAANPEMSAATQGVSLQVASFTLYAVKIYPSVVSVHPGLIAILVEDQSGGSSGLVVEQSKEGATTRFGVVQHAVDSWRGRSEIQLAVGSYEVYMADRPENRATLVVTP